MKKMQAGNLIGYVNFEMHSEDAVPFIRHCQEQNIYVWDVRKKDSDIVTGKLYWHQFKRWTELAVHLDVDMHQDVSKGLLPFVLRFICRKEIITAAVISVLFVLLLSNLVWKIEVAGVSKEIEMKIRRELDNHGLYGGAMTFQASPLDEIQQALLYDIPELLYLGIEKKGTVYRIDAVEKLQEKKESESPSAFLVASKTGVVDKMLLKSGIAKIEVHDFVEKGDVLVTGVVELEEAGDDPDKEVKTEVIGAEGKVYATTWYKMVVTMPVHTNKENLTGAYRTRHRLVIQDLSLPIWGFLKNPYSKYIADDKDVTPKLFKWKLPFQIKRTTYYETYQVSTDYMDESKKEKAIDQALGDVSEKLGNDAEIQNYNVLHESTDNGKVKMTLYISVMENIAVPK